MDFFSIVLLTERHCPKNGSEDHARSVNPRHRLVKFYRTALFGSGNSGCANGIVSGDAVQISRQAA